MRIAVILSILILCGCSSKWYLPKSDYVGSSPYGAYIQLTSRDFKKIEGELIAVDNDYIFILRDFTFIFADDYQTVSKVSVNDVYRFKIRYANPDKTGWYLLGGAVLPFIHVPDPEGFGWGGSGVMPFHGYFSIFSVPINILSILVIQSNTYVYNHGNLEINELHMFARFPQGIPEGVDIEDIIPK